MNQIIAANYRNVSKQFSFCELLQREEKWYKNIYKVVVWLVNKCLLWEFFPTSRTADRRVTGPPCELQFFLPKIPIQLPTNQESKTHLAFHFHRVAVRISQRLRLVKAPIHFVVVAAVQQVEKCSSNREKESRGKRERAGSAPDSAVKIRPLRL